MPKKPYSRTPAAIHYTPAEEQLWQRLTRQLNPLHKASACDEYLQAKARLLAGISGVPLHPLVSERLEKLSNFQLEPTAGTVPLQQFFGKLAERIFLATGFVRDSLHEGFSPEPDWFHEFWGHAVMLASRRVADLYQRFGQAALRAKNQHDLDQLGRLFWFSTEVGLVWEEGQLKVFGSAILSSIAEMTSYYDAEIRPFNPTVIVQTDYRIDQPQPILFAADDVEHLIMRSHAYLHDFARN